MYVLGERTKGNSQDVLAFRILPDWMWLLSWGGGLCSYMWVGGTIRWGSYRHLPALLSHCWSLWHPVLTVLASAENWESYWGSGVLWKWDSEETLWFPGREDASSYPTGTTAEDCTLVLRGGSLKHVPSWGKMLLVHRLKSIQRLSLEELPKNRYPLDLFWVTESGSVVMFSNRGKGIAFMLFRHDLIYVTAYSPGRRYRGQVFPFQA